MLASNLGLGNDQLQRVTAIGLVDGVLQDTDGLEQVAGDLDLVGEVGRIGDNLLGLGLELHGRGLVVAILHGGLDTGDLATFVIQDLIDVGVQHVSTTVDGRKTSKALGELAQAVQRVDVRRLAVAGHGVDVEADTVDSLDGGAGLVDVLVRGVEGHGVTNEITGVILEAELVIHLLHGAATDVETYSKLAIIIHPGSLLDINAPW